MGALGIVPPSHPFLMPVPLQRDLWFQENFKNGSNPALQAYIVVSFTTGEDRLQPCDITLEASRAVV